MCKIYFHLEHFAEISGKQTDLTSGNTAFPDKNSIIMSMCHLFTQDNILR